MGQGGVSPERRHSSCYSFEWSCADHKGMAEEISWDFEINTGYIFVMIFMEPGFCDWCALMFEYKFDSWKLFSNIMPTAITSRFSIRFDWFSFVEYYGLFVLHNTCCCVITQGPQILAHTEMFFTFFKITFQKFLMCIGSDKNVTKPTPLGHC